MQKAMQPVAMLHDAFALHVVKNAAHLRGSKFVMIEKRYETGDDALKVDVVFPEGVVGVDKKGLRLVDVFRRAGQMRNAPRKTFYATQSTRASGPIIPALWPMSSRRTTLSRPSVP